MGVHPTRKAAYAQERAVHASEARASERYRKIEQAKKRARAACACGT